MKETPRCTTRRMARRFAALTPREKAFWWPIRRSAPTGCAVVTAADNDRNRVKIWDASNGSLLRTLKGHSGDLISLAFTPDSRRVITASADGTVRVWNADTGKELKRLKRSDQIPSAIPSADSRHIYVQWGSDADRRDVIWNTETGHLDEIPAGAEVLGFGPTSNWYLVAEGGGTTKESPNNLVPMTATLYDVPLGRPFERTNEHISSADHRLPTGWVSLEGVAIAVPLNRISVGGRAILLGHAIVIIRSTNRTAVPALDSRIRNS